MKKFYLFLLSLVVSTASFSAPIIRTISSNNWSTSSIWDLDRLPQIGDTIVVSSGNTITVNNDIVVNGGVYIKIYGTVSFQNNNSSIVLADPSKVVVLEGGKIVGVSASQKIRIAGNVVFQGNTTIVGPTIATALTTGFVAYPLIALPVKFIGFTVANKNNDVLVQWSTSEELNAVNYQVERSIDGDSWNTIGYIAAIGSSSTLNNYSFIDKNSSLKTTYYRIKEVDVNGKETMTSIKSIKAEPSSATEIKIAGIQNKLLLQFPQQINGNLTVRFVSAGGQIMDQQNINNPVGQVVLNSKITGSYIISISNGQDINTAKQVIL